MKICFIDWKCFGREDLIFSLKELGHEVSFFSHPDYDLRSSSSFVCSFSEHIDKTFPELVFSFNYFPLVSIVCEKYNIPYASWVYDCPHLSLFSATIINKCNHVFLFDSETYDFLHSSGIETVHYLPLGVCVSRLDSMTPNRAIHTKLDCDVSFVGSMYDESHNLFDRLTDLDDYTKGYLDAIISSQLQVSGYSFTEDVLSERIMSSLRKSSPYVPQKDGVETDKYIYSRFFIDRKISELERKSLLFSVSSKYDTKLYTHNPTPYLPEICNLGAVDPYNEMPYVFKCSKINLNITLRSIHTGIPLRAIDIMGAGGFLLSNFQSDFLMDFEPDRDFVYYENEKDLLNKISHYLTHDNERKAIALNGYNKVRDLYSFNVRLKEILSQI